MGMLIDHTFFYGLLSVGLSPDTGAGSTTKSAERYLLDSYIDVYEREYLCRILGEDASSVFANYLTREDTEEGTEERWERLKELLLANPSPVACYVYVHYTGECGMSVTDTGVVKSAAEGDLVAPCPLQVRAWNLMARQNRRVFELLCGEEYDGVVFDNYMMETINDLGI